MRTGAFKREQCRFSFFQKKEEENPFSWPTKSRETPVTSDLEVDPAVECDEPFSVLDINVPSEQQHGERWYQSGVTQVDLCVLHLWMNIFSSDVTGEKNKTCFTHTLFIQTFSWYSSQPCVCRLRLTDDGWT